MRRFSGSILLLLFICSWMGWSALYQLKLSLHQTQMAQNLKESAHEGLVNLKITPEERTKLTWEEPGREFRYQGMMYDVLSLDTSSAGVILCTCFADPEEARLKQQFIAGLTTGHPHESATLPSLIFKLWCMPTLVPASWVLKPMTEVPGLVRNSLPGIRNFILDPFSPPPESC